MRNCYKVAFEYEVGPDDFETTNYVMEYAEDAIHFANWAAYSKEFLASGRKVPDAIYVFPMRAERTSFVDANGDRHDLAPLVENADEEHFLAAFHDVKANVRREFE